MRESEMIIRLDYVSGIQEKLASLARRYQASSMILGSFYNSKMSSQQLLTWYKLT